MMMTKLLITLGLLTSVCCLSALAVASDAPETASNSNVANDIATEGATEGATEVATEVATGEAVSNSAGDATQQGKVTPQDTLAGSGLKNKKLSVIFEQFVPSETISADNAVPFPTDI